MKKQYVNPTICIVRVHSQQLMTTSVEFGDGLKDGGEAASRRGNLWDDEEYEDY